MPELQAIVLIGRDGRADGVERAGFGKNRRQLLADRDYFKAQVEKDAGTYVSEHPDTKSFRRRK